MILGLYVGINKKNLKKFDNGDGKNTKNHWIVVYFERVNIMALLF